MNKNELNLLLNERKEEGRKEEKNEAKNKNNKTDIRSFCLTNIQKARGTVNKSASSQGSRGTNPVEICMYVYIYMYI